MWEPRKPRLCMAGQPRRVLVVDDDQLQLRALQRFVRSLPDGELLTGSNAIDERPIIGTDDPNIVAIDLKKLVGPLNKPGERSKSRL